VARLSVLTLALLAVAPACSQSGAPAPLPSARPLTAVGLDFTEAQRAVTRFLEAYAESSEDIRALDQAVGGSDMHEWVRWLEVQNRGTTLTGQVHVDRVRVLEISGDFAAVGVDATVRFSLPGDQVLTRRFQSPFLLAREGAGDRWVVFDAVRDGRSMQESIGLLRPPARASRGGITVEVASVFRFTAGTLVNIVVRNDTSRPVEVATQETTLSTSALPLNGSATNPVLGAPIEPGSRVEGMIEFAPLLLDQAPEAFVLSFAGGNPAPIEVPLPAEAFAGQP
jgi:hypothetical protein